jgi:Helix-turn-helix domain
LSDQCVVEWSEVPIMLKVEEAMRVLRIGRSKAYEMTTLYETSGGTKGLPCLRMDGLLRIPRFALQEYVTTGRIVQLIPQPDLIATPVATVSRPPDRKPRAGARTQLSLLGSD